MPLNNIKLSPSLVAELYRHSLVEEDNNAKQKISDSPLETKKSPVEINEMTQWRSLGDFRKNILLIVNYPSATYLPDEQLNFLTSILAACKLSLADVAIINLVHTPSTFYKDVLNQFKSRITVLFEIDPAEFSLPVNFPEFQVQPFNNCTFLWSPGLEKLESDQLLKSKFWVCLRKIFEV